MHYRDKPKVYSPEIVDRLVAHMKANKLSMAAACASRIDLPSYNRAKAWLVAHAYFRNIHPYPNRNFFAGKSEEDLRALRKLPEDAWRARLLS